MNERHGQTGPRRLSALEQEIMLVIWDKERTTAKEIKAALDETRPLAQTTILTVLSRLKGKGYVHEVPSLGRSLLFEASVPRDDVAQRDVQRVIDHYFDGSPSRMVQYLVENGAMDHAESQAIRREIDTAAHAKREGALAAV